MKLSTYKKKKRKAQKKKSGYDINQFWCFGAVCANPSK